MNIEKANLAGPSLAEVELTHFAATHPDRVEKLIYLDALDDRRGLPEIHKQNPLRKIETKREASTPRTFEEYVADTKRDSPYIAEIWSELWDVEMSHEVKVNEDGIFVDRMPESVAEMMFEDLCNGYAPKEWMPKYPLSVFTRWGYRNNQMLTPRNKKPRLINSL